MIDSLNLALSEGIRQGLGATFFLLFPSSKTSPFKSLLKKARNEEVANGWLWDQTGPVINRSSVNNYDTGFGVEGSVSK